MTRVLVVDDSPVIAELLDLVLGMKGHSVTVITDASELLDTEHPAWVTDVLICDLMMPTPGLEILELCRTKHPGVLRIALTAADSSTADLIEAATSVAHRVLRKPDDVNLVVDIVSTLDGSR